MFPEDFDSWFDEKKIFYLGEIYDPYVHYKVENNELIPVFAEDTPEIAKKAWDMVQEIHSSPTYEPPR